MSSELSGAVPAPGLAEVAAAWWDLERTPEVAWLDDQTFVLRDPADHGHQLHLARLNNPCDDPEHIARVLAEGLAGCDFPPTGDGADPGHVAATLRAHGIDT